MKTVDLGLTYKQALHGIQCANGYRLARGDTAGDAKRLRTGIDAAHVTDHAVGELLIAKGVFTIEEYTEQLRISANSELAGHEETYGIKFRGVDNLG